MSILILYGYYMVRNGPGPALVIYRWPCKHSFNACSVMGFGVGVISSDCVEVLLYREVAGNKTPHWILGMESQPAPLNTSAKIITFFVTSSTLCHLYSMIVCLFFFFLAVQVKWLLHHPTLLSYPMWICDRAECSRNDWDWRWLLWARPGRWTPAICLCSIDYRVTFTYSKRRLFIGCSSLP